jgi:predicted AlkP superfamily pyrophosphatase or phosphodiesterase
MQKTGADAGVFRLTELQERMEKALEPFGFPKPAIAQIATGEVYFAPDAYERLRENDKAMRAVIDAGLAQTGVAAIFRAEQVQNRPATQSPIQAAVANGYFPGRSGDLFIISNPYWFMDRTPAGKPRSYGTSHSSPYNYDQHVPVLFMGFGIRHGEYFDAVTPADVAPTLAALCGITLATRDGHPLAQALAK